MPSLRARRKKPPIEVVDLSRSPFNVRLTKRKLARLLRTPLHALQGLLKYKNSFVVREDREINGKVRRLAYPEGKLRVINEKLAYQFRKIQLPPYVMSPRKGRGQRDNAAAHVNGKQFLQLDIRKFYPSIKRERVARFLRNECGTTVDVAGMLTGFLTVDDAIAFGAPATPVFALLVCRGMFDEVYELCRTHDLTMTLWVDDLTISGEAIPGSVVAGIRAIVARHGFESHKVVRKASSRPVDITGVLVDRAEIRPINSVNLRVRDLEREVRAAMDADSFAYSVDRLLSALGTMRYIVGAKTPKGLQITNRMHALRQKKAARLQRAAA